VHFGQLSFGAAGRAAGAAEGGGSRDGDERTDGAENAGSDAIDAGMGVAVCVVATVVPVKGVEAVADVVIRAGSEGNAAIVAAGGADVDKAPSSARKGSVRA